MDRRTLLRGGVALAWGALMPAADLVSLDDMAARTHVLRRREEEAQPGSVEALERHAAALAAMMRWNPRPGLGSVVADACAAAAIASYDAGQDEATVRWASIGQQMAEDADDSDMYALNAARLARVLLEGRRPEDALALLEDAEAPRRRPLSPYTLSFLEGHHALANATTGNRYASAAAIDRADVALEGTSSAPKPNWARTVGPNWLAAWRARCALRAGRPHLAEAPARQVLSRAPARLTMARAEARVSLAEVAWARDDLEETCMLLKDAAPDLMRGGANRQLRQVRTLRRDVAPHAGSRHVRDLDEVLNA